MDNLVQLFPVPISTTILNPVVNRTITDLVYLLTADHLGKIYLYFTVVIPSIFKILILARDLGVAKYWFWLFFGYICWFINEIHPDYRSHCIQIAVVIGLIYTAFGSRYGRIIISSIVTFSAGIIFLGNLLENQEAELIDWLLLFLGFWIWLADDDDVRTVEMLQIVYQRIQEQLQILFDSLALFT